jgi:hypothetical protein
MKMFKYKLIVAGLLLIVSMVVSPGIVQAHEEVTDGTMTVTMHIDPNDAPMAGVPQTLNFYFTDTPSKFGLKNCACTLEISSPQSQTLSNQLHFVGDNHGAWPVTFERAQTYSAKVSGSPKKAGTFAPFKATYEIQVARNPALKSNFDPTGTTGRILYTSLGIGMLLVLIVTGYIVRDSRKSGTDLTE